MSNSFPVSLGLSGIAFVILVSAPKFTMHKRLKFHERRSEARPFRPLLLYCELSLWNFSMRINLFRKIYVASTTENCLYTGKKQRLSFGDFHSFSDPKGFLASIIEMLLVFCFKIKVLYLFGAPKKRVSSRFFLWANFYITVHNQ